MDVRPIPGQEHLPWAEVWVRTAAEQAWQEASREARALGKTGLEVWTTEEYPDVVAFFEQRGYEEVRRYLRFALDVDAAPDPGESEWELTTLAERPELLPQVYDVALETYVDQPGREDAQIGAIDVWRTYAYDPHPKDAFIVALAGDRVVGFGFLVVDGDQAEHQMTGVARAWRGRGIAEAIKCAHIRWAKANGLRVLRTANEVRIPAIRRLNERYGYRPEPAEIVMRGPLARQPGHSAVASTIRDSHEEATVVSTTTTQMAETMQRQPTDLRRILGDRTPIEDAAARIDGRRVYVVGTGTSWHAANQGAYFLRLAGVDAVPVSAADCALWGPAPTTTDALILLSHKGTKRYTTQVLARARADGVATVAIGGIGAPGVDVVTVERETAGTFTASHIGALARLAQLAVALGADLGDLDAVPDAVRDALDASPRTVELPERGLDFGGAGPNQWTAAEGALKVREAANLFTAGYAVEQLLHGPGFALGPRDALVCLDGGGPGAPRLAELAKAVENRGTRVYRFAATELGEPLSMFPLTVTVQRIALAFAVQLGTDPDDVRPDEWQDLEL